MSESITNIELNFTNSGGGHSASIRSVLNPKKIQTGEDLGIVIGDLGEVNDFSNENISKMMSRFICTQITKSSDPTKKTISRKYVDRTSLILNSYIVLLRGMHLGPEGGLNFEGGMPFYSEVSNSPLDSFQVLEPKRNGSIIEAGRIFNAESASTEKGVKMNLVYNNKELIEKLSLNTDFVSEQYKSQPDLSQYDLKFGYNLGDFKKIINLAGLRIEGLPDENEKDVLFEASGTLNSVVSTIASYLGYFWFTDPDTGIIKFINTSIASQLEIENFTETNDPNILNASFSESKLSNKIVNSYSGTSEKDRGSESSDDDDRLKSVFLKRVRFERLKKEGEEDDDNAKPLLQQKCSRIVMGAYFSIFDQNESEEVFNKFTYLMSIFASGDYPQAKFEDYFEENDLEENGPFNVNDLYLEEFEDDKGLIAKVHKIIGVDEDGENLTEDIVELRPYVKLDLDDFARQYSIYDDPNKQAAKDQALKTKLKVIDENDENKKVPANRITNRFKYFHLKNRATKPMPKAKETALHPFLETYFSIAGGIYISNGYSKYKADRMSFDNKNGIDVLGPFNGDDKISKHDELEPISSMFKLLDKDLDPKINKLAELTQGKKGVTPAVSVHNNYFIGIRALPKLKKANPVNDRDKVQDKVDYNTFITQSFEFFEHHNDLFLGGPIATGGELGFEKEKDMVDAIMALVLKSNGYYKKATETKNTIKLNFRRSKTRVVKDDEEGEEKEDDDIAASSTGAQQNIDLSDRFDLIFKSVESPPHSILNKLTLSSLSGSTAEMKVLQSIRGKFNDVLDIPKSSSRTVYGLQIPKFKPTINGISISITSNGVRTTIDESTIKIIPPDQNFLLVQGMEALTPKSSIPTLLSASQRNRLGL